MEPISIKPIPQYVGSWKIPGCDVYIAATKKPRWLTRFLAKHLFEMEWKDEV